MSAIVLETNLPGLKLVNRGKVRDIYDLGEYLLLVTSDRISAFDVIMNEGIPQKGLVLNQMSIFWFNLMQDIIPNHIVATEVDDYPAETRPYSEQLKGRSMLVKKAQPPAGRMHRARLHFRLRLERLPEDQGHLRHHPAGRSQGERPPPRSRSSPRRPRPNWVSMTRTSPSKRPSSCAARRSPTRSATPPWRSTRRPATSPGTRGSSSPTPSSSSASWTMAA